MTFSLIGILLLALSLPLWIYREALFLGLSARGKGILKRVRSHGDSAMAFAARTFGITLLTFGAGFAVLLLIRFLKYGDARFESLSEIFRGRLYLGYEAFDDCVDMLVYNQVLPVGLIIMCLAFSSGLALVLSALRDILLIRELKRRISELGHGGSPGHSPSQPGA